MHPWQNKLNPSSYNFVMGIYLFYYYVVMKAIPPTLLWSAQLGSEKCWRFRRNTVVIFEFKLIFSISTSWFREILYFAFGSNVIVRILYCFFLTKVIQYFSIHSYFPDRNVFTGWFSARTVSWPRSTVTKRASSKIKFFWHFKSFCKKMIYIFNI